MNVLITRGEYAEKTSLIFANAGLTPFVLPMTKHVFLDAKPPCSIDYLILTSPLAAGFAAEKKLSAKTYVAIGKITAQAAKKLLTSRSSRILMPLKSYGNALLSVFKDEDIRGKKVVYAGAEEKLHSYKDFFDLHGAFYEECALYRTEPIIYKKGAIKEFVIKNSIDVITFFAPSQAKSFLYCVEEFNFKIVCLGKSTQKVFDAAGIKTYSSPVQTAEGMAEYIAGILRV